MTSISRVVAVFVSFVSVAALAGLIPTAAAQSMETAGLAQPANAIVDVGVGYYHTCAVLQDGTVDCWGTRRLGNGTLTDFSTLPVKVQGVSNATRISAGQNQTCVIVDTGQVKCWGFSTALPAAVGGINNAIEIVQGYEHACALIGGGSVKCWGSSRLGQLGNGISTNNQGTVTVPGVTDAVMLTSIGWHTCALLGNGTITCWGHNGSGQLGNGTSFGSPSPITVPGIDNATHVDANARHTCAVLAGGTVTCWGRNYEGQLGNNTTNPLSGPETVQGISNASKMSVGSFHSCALLLSGRVKCWGAVGGLGDGNAVSPVPLEVAGITTATHITAGPAQKPCAVQDGQVTCWGTHGTPPNAISDLDPGTIEGTANAISVHSGPNHACATTTNGTAQCWGVGTSGQLGGGNTYNSRVAVTVLFPDDEVRLLEGSPGANDGWAVVGSVRMYVQPACRAQLTAAGRTFATTPWPQISALAQQPSPACDLIERFPHAPDDPPPRPSAGSVAFVTNSATNDAGWALVDGTRQWLNPACRTQLQAAGASFAITTWADIAANPNTTSSQTCDALQSSIGEPPPTEGALFETTVNTNGGFWIVGTQRQWLNNTCMNQLKAAGATVTAAPWTQIAPTTDTPNLTTCGQLLSAL